MPPDKIPREEALRREYLKGHFARLDRDFDRVEQSARRMLALDPQSVSAHDFLGDVYAARGDKEKAAGFYQQALILYYEQRPNEHARDDKGPILEPPVAIYRKLHELQKTKFK